MADVAHKKTDEMLTELEKKIKREYNTARKEVQGKMNAYFEKVTAQEKVQKELLKAGKITQQEYNDWMIRKTAMGKRWEELRDNLADDMNNHRKIAQSITKGFQADAYALNHNFAVYQCEHDGKCSTVYQLYDRHTVERLMEQDQQLMPPAGRRVKQAIKEGRAKRWNKQRLQSALTQSILQGESVGQIADRVSRAVSVMSYNDAIRYARTMITGAECAGRNDGFKAAEEMGIDLEKEWIATLDDRTRHSHREMHGVRVPVDDAFPNGCRFPADPYCSDPSEVYNCRCTMKASIKGFDRQRVESSPKMGDLSFEEWQGVKRKQEDTLYISFSPPTNYTLSDCAVRAVKEYGFPSGSWGQVRKTAPATVYTTPDGIEFVFPKSYNKKNQTLTPEQLLAAYNRVPQEIRTQGQKEIVIHDVYNPIDAYWRKHYKNFTHSYMTGGDQISVWRYSYQHDEDYLVHSLCHEMGHKIDREDGSFVVGKVSSGDEWKNAMAKDLEKSGKKSPTRYGENSNAEDFADSVSMVQEDQLTMMLEFPNRFEILKKILGKR